MLSKLLGLRRRRPRWRAVHVGLEGDDLEIDSVKIWQEDWRRIDGEGLELPHPSYPRQRHGFRVCEVGSIDHPVRFAVGELSNRVYGFYVPD